MSTIESQWNTYLEMVIPANAGVNQITETRRAFYAGCYAVLSSLVDLVETEADEQAGAEKIQELIEECRAFVQGENC